MASKDIKREKSSLPVHAHRPKTLVLRELKHQRFLIHERHCWPRIFSWKCLSRICVKFCFFLTKKTWFQRKKLYFCMTNTLRRTQNLNLWFQPENSRFEVRDRSSRTSWHAQWLSCCKNTSGWRPWYQERLVLKFPIISDKTSPLLVCGVLSDIKSVHVTYEY